MDDNLEAIMALSRQLGEAIRQHPRYIKLREADDRVREDKSATEALDAYNRGAGEISKKERSGQPIEVDDKRRLQRLHEVVASNETIKAFMRTQADYAELMRKMNDTIFQAIAAAEKAQPKA